MLSSSTYRVHPGLGIVLSETERVDFEALNEAYHHVAILQVQKRIPRLPDTLSHIQYSVAEITKCLSRISLPQNHVQQWHYYKPIFVAGCEASNEENKRNVVIWLDRMESYYAMGNARYARDFLKELWAARDSRIDCPYLQWDVFLGESNLQLSLY